MEYKYKEIILSLEDEEVYWLWDIVAFALDLDAKEKVLTDDKRHFAKKLIDILDESKYVHGDCV